MSGWVKIHRDIFDHDFWKGEKFSRGQAWIDLVLLANHKENSFYKRGIKVVLKRGQFARSEKELADRWGWSRGKVRRYFLDLKMRQQIVQQKSTVIQVVTILNYDTYQTDGTTNGTTDGTTDGTTNGHIQECKEGKEGKEVQLGTNKFIIPSIQDIQDHMDSKGCRNSKHEANQFWNYYDSIDWYVGKKKMKRWKSAASRWVGNSQKVENVITWD